MSTKPQRKEDYTVFYYDVATASLQDITIHAPHSTVINIVDTMVSAQLWHTTAIIPASLKITKKSLV